MEGGVVGLAHGTLGVLRAEMKVFGEGESDCVQLGRAGEVVAAVVLDRLGVVDIELRDVMPLKQELLLIPIRCRFPDSTGGFDSGFSWLHQGLLISLRSWGSFSCLLGPIIYVGFARLPGPSKGVNYPAPSRSASFDHSGLWVIINDTW